MSLLIAFVPRILLGYLAGLIYEKLCRKGINENVGIIAGALTGAITNTVLVLGGIYLFFGSAYADAIKVAYDTLIAVSAWRCGNQWNCRGDFRSGCDPAGM